MKVKLLVFLALALLLGAAAAQDDSVLKEVKGLQDKLNEAFKASDVARIKPLVTDDHIGVTSFYDKPLSFAEQIQAVGESTVTEYSAGRMTLTRLGEDVVQITYHATLTGTYRGKPMPSRVFVSALWVKRAGRWLEHFYQETPLGAP